MLTNRLNLKLMYTKNSLFQRLLNKLKTWRMSCNS